MKSLVAALALITLLSLQAKAEQPMDLEDEEVSACTADIKFLDGYQTMVYVECESENAGKCFEEVKVADKSDWKEVSCK